MIKNELNFEEFASGVDDARADISGGWLPENVTINYLVNELRVAVGATDAYLAGYISVVFNPQNRGVI
jgi:hypothetical protein